MKKKILYTLLAALIAIQFFPVDRNNPAVVDGEDYMDIVQVSDENRLLIESACYDCHSNTTDYPWYFRPQPLGWWLKGHVKGGRSKLNFSEWGSLSAEDRNHALHECAEVLENNRMPLSSYTKLHSEAKLSEEQRAALIKHFNQ